MENEEDLGRYYIDEFQAIAIPRDMLPYFNYEAYGRDIDLSGCFAPGVYVAADTGCFTEYYHGPEDILEKHKIFAYPEERAAALISRRLRLKPEEEYTAFEVDASDGGNDEDADILNYDDLNNADDFD